MRNNQIPKPKVFLTGLGVFFSLILLDQITKHWTPDQFKNYQFAFSLPVPTSLMYVIYFLVMSVMTVYILQNYFKFRIGETIAWGLILAGGLSNVGERLFLGYVRDWIYLFNGVFNLADGYIILGILILLVYSLMTKTTEMTKST